MTFVKFTDSDVCECGTGVLVDGTQVDDCGDWVSEGYQWCYLKGKPKQGSLSTKCLNKAEPTWSSDTHQYWSSKLCAQGELMLIWL